MYIHRSTPHQSSNPSAPPFRQEQQALIKELLEEVQPRQLQTYATSAELSAQVLLGVFHTEGH